MPREWMEDAACAGHAEFLDLPPKKALAFCSTCPVLSQCLGFAIETHSSGVVMGGVSIPEHLRLSLRTFGANREALLTITELRKNY